MNLLFLLNILISVYVFAQKILFIILEVSLIIQGFSTF